MPRRSMVVVVAVMLAWGWLTPAGRADAAGWERAVLVAASEMSSNDYQLVVTSTGETVAAWIEQNHADIRAFSAVVRADGTIEQPVELARNLAGCVLDIAADAQGTVVIALSHADGQIDAYRRPARGSFGEAEIVRRGGTGWGAPKVAMSPSGDAAILTRDGSFLDVWVSRDGGPWGDPRWLGSGGEFGHDVAMTPAGDVVALWLTAGDEDGSTAAKATTLHADGTRAPVQVLRSSTSTKTCPQVEANALGQVAALWHEIEETQCGEWGADVLALRPAGATAFQTPQIVPGAQSAAALGQLGLTDDGRLTVSYDGANGGQIVSGPFGGVLTARQLGGGPLALGTDPAGADIVAVGDPAAYGAAGTRRLQRDGVLGPVQRLPFDADVDTYMRVDEGGGRAAALVNVYGSGLHVVSGTPAADAPASDEPAGDEPASAGGTATAGGGRLGGWTVTPPQPDFAAWLQRVRVRRGAVTVAVGCTPRCSATVRLTLTGRRGARVHRIARARPVLRRGVLTFRLARREVRRLGRRPYRVTARLSALSPSGQRAEAVTRRRE